MQQYTLHIFEDILLCIVYGGPILSARVTFHFAILFIVLVLLTTVRN